jgi:hypothetical protein
MPVALMHVYADQMEALEAEESLRASQRVAVGSGAMKPEDAKAIHRQWITAASVAVVTRPATSAVLPMLGIGLRGGRRG